MLRRLAIIGVLVGLAAACGGDDSADPAAEPPKNPTIEQSEPAPETRPTDAGPPLVTASADGREIALPTAGGCWREDGMVTCGDPPAPSCSDPAIPHLEVRDDGVLAVSIGVRPEALGVLWEDGTEEVLPVGGSIAWRPATTGLALLQIDLGDRGSGSFAICVDPS